MAHRRPEGDDDAAGAEGATLVEDADPSDDEHPRAPDDAASRPSRRRLDARTLALCAVVALLAAVLAGVIADRIIGDDGTDDPARTELTAAEEVPDVAVERFDGTEVSLTDFAGQPMVVNFWGSWCAPCIEEMPDLQRVHEAVGEDVAFVGVNLRDDREAAEAMVEATGVTYDLVIDVDGDLARHLDVVNLPVTLLVLPDGTIATTYQARVSAERLCDGVNQTLLNGQLTECV